MATFKQALLLQLLFLAAVLQAQEIPLIRSGAVIKEAMVLYDSGNYDRAIDLYKTIPARDTNYVHALSELAMTYLANKNYDEVIAACEEGLSHPSEYRAHLFRSLGSAFDLRGDYEKSVSAFERGISEFPFDYSMHYNLAVAHYNHKHFDKATEYFFNTLRINPYHPGSHLNLGRLAAFQGKKVRAMMALGMYLSISNTDNPRLVFLERFLNNEIPEEGTFPFEGSGAFDRLDQIIRAKVVMDKNFKPVVDVNAILARQYQLFLDQLDLIGNEPEEPWIAFYLPIYRNIKEKNLLEPFLYHILNSSSIEAVAKWRKKNDKKLAEFFSLANGRLSGYRSVRTLPTEFGFQGQVNFWYNEKNDVEAIGNTDNNKVRIGAWRFYDPNGVCTAMGPYDKAGSKTGTWKYYHRNGFVKSIENYVTGEIQLYNIDGEPKHHYTLTDGEINGTVEIFFPCGQIKEKLTYVAGKRSGGGTTYFSNGQVESEYNFKDDRLEGSYVEYYADGKIMGRNVYRDGRREGPHEEFFPNGNPKERGRYDAGVLAGKWEYFHANGSLERSGSYHNGEPAGSWKYYNIRGQLIEERTYDEKGEIHGDDTIYRDGKVDFIYTYNHGRFAGMAYFDSSGEEIARSGDPGGTFSAKGYYPDGKIRFEGGYRTGRANGLWKYYYHEGGLRKQYTYADDTIQGEFIEYFRNGALKYRQQFKDGKADGYSREYYIHGQVKEEGWYQDGNREQRWISWYPDGTMESDYYYERGSLAGECIDYNTDGKPYSAYTYRAGRIISLEYYDKGKDIRLGRILTQENERLEEHYADGNLHSQMTLSCGYFSGRIEKFYPNGTPYSVQDVLNGRRYGGYEQYQVNGLPKVKGQYLDGEESGIWVWYNDNGNKEREGKYVAGERDSIWTYYFHNGTVSSRSSYKGGELHGVSQLFSPGGMLIVEKRFEEGDLMDYRVMTIEGQLGGWRTFTGNETIRARYPNGKDAYTASYRNGLLHGANRLSFLSGQVYYEFHYEDGDSSGPYVYYYQNGKTREMGNFVKDEFDGVLEYYNEDGTKHLTETYRLGVRNGKFISYKKAIPVSEVDFWAGIIVD